MEQSVLFLVGEDFHRIYKKNTVQPTFKHKFQLRLSLEIY